MERNLTRLSLLGLGALALGVGLRMGTLRSQAKVVLPPNATGIVPADVIPPVAGPGGRHPRWTAVWTRLTPDLRDLALALDGDSVVWVDAHGSLRRLSATSGATTFQSPPLMGVDAVAAGAGGVVLAYSRMNPQNGTVLRFAGSDSVVSPAHENSVVTPGAVWCVAAAPTGDTLFVGTGKSSLIVVGGNGDVSPQNVANPVQPAHPTTATIPTQGIPNSIAAATTTDQTAAAFVAGTWQDAGICAWNLGGKPLWRHDDPRPDRQYDVHLSADGSTVVAISSRKPRSVEPRIMVWDGRTGRLIWSQMLLDAADDRAVVNDARALVSAKGNVIALTYAEMPQDAIPFTAPTRKLALYNRTGNKLFADKGGRFFAPQLVALSSDGHDVTVRDDSGSLRILDDGGRILSHTPLTPDPKTGRLPVIRGSQVSADGRTLLLERVDGQISLYKVAAQ